MKQPLTPVCWSLDKGYCYTTAFSSVLPVLLETQTPLLKAYFFDLFDFL